MITDRVIRPGCQTPFVSIFAPRASETRFGDDRTELGVGQNVGPRSGRWSFGTNERDVFPPVASKTACAVELQEIGSRSSPRRSPRCRGCSCRLQRGAGGDGRRTAGNLFF